MMKNQNFKASEVLAELVKNQKNKLLLIARKVVPHITPEDLLQPQDYPELDFNPDFRYEEGVLHGMESALSAVRAHITKGFTPGSVHTTESSG